MKDLLFGVHVFVKTLNLEISRCHLTDYVEEFVPHVQYDYFSSFNQSDHCFLVLSLPMLSLLLKLPTNSQLLPTEYVRW